MARGLGFSPPQGPVHWTFHLCGCSPSSTGSTHSRPLAAHRHRRQRQRHGPTQRLVAADPVLNPRLAKVTNCDPATVIGVECQPGARGVPFLPCTRECVRVSGFPPLTRSCTTCLRSPISAFRVLLRTPHKARHHRAVRGPGARHRRRPRRARRPRPVADRLGQDPRLRPAARRAASSPRPRPAALVLAPTRELALQIVDELRDVAAARALSSPRSTAASGSRSRPSKAARAHIVVATPGRLEDLLHRGASASTTPDPGHRRGRPDARHGLQAGRRPDRRARPRATARRCSSRRRSRPRPASSPAPTPATPRRHVHEPVEDDRARSRTASSISPRRQGRRPGRRAARRRARPDARLRPHQARRRPPGQAARQAPRSRTRDARQQVAEPAQARARPASPRATSTPSSPPTSPPAGSTSTTSPT